MRWVGWFVLSMGLIVAGEAAADSPEPDYAGMLLKNDTLLSAPPKSCDEKTASLNNVELQQCAAVAFRKADQDMNRAYAAAIAGSDPARNEALRRTQRSWLAFRNAQCDWAAMQYEGGTLAPVAMGHCLVEVTRDRVRQLQYGVQP